MGSRLFRARTNRPLPRDVERYRRGPNSEQGRKPTTVPASDKGDNEALLKRLNTVYVEAKTSTVQVANPFGEGLKQSERKLPERRTAAFASLHEDTAIPRGLLSIDQVVEILAKRREDSVKWTPSLIADEYEVNVDNVELLLKHFNTFQVMAKLKMETELKSSPD